MKKAARSKYINTSSVNGVVVVVELVALTGVLFFQIWPTTHQPIHPTRKQIPLCTSSLPPPSIIQ